MIRTKVPGNRLEFDSSKNLTRNIRTKTLIVAPTSRVVASEPALVTSPEQVANLYGSGEILSSMVNFFVENNPREELWVYPIPEDSSWVRASQEFNIAGSVSESGSMVLDVLGDRVEIFVTRGMTAGDVRREIHTRLARFEDSSFLFRIERDGERYIANNESGNQGDFNISEVAGIEISYNAIDGDNGPYEILLTGTVESDSEVTVTYKSEVISSFSVPAGRESAALMEEIFNSYSAYLEGLRVVKVTGYSVYTELNGNSLRFFHKNRGDFANRESISVVTSPSGINADEAILSGGVGGFRALDSLVEGLGDIHFNSLIFYQYQRSTLFNAEDELELRFGKTIQKEMMVYVGRRGDFNALPSTLNSKHVCILGYNGSTTTAYKWAAAMAGSAIESLSQDPALPLKTKVVNGVNAPRALDRFNERNREFLLNNGVSTFKVDDSDRVRIERLVTSYTRNAAGRPDESYLDVTTYYLSGWLRIDYLNILAQKYARKKLGENGGDYAPESNVVTPSDVFDETVAVLSDWEELGFIEQKDEAIESMVVNKVGDDLDVFFDLNYINKLLNMNIKVSFLR